MKTDEKEPTTWTLSSLPAGAKVYVPSTTATDTLAAPSTCQTDLPLSPPEPGDQAESDAAAKDEEVDEHGGGTKSFVSELKAEDDDEGTFIATITTGMVDRQHEVVIAKGIDLENFQKLPTVLFGHDHNGLAIGKALWIRAKGSKIIAKVKMAPTEFAQEVFALIKGGFLGAVSIGFRGLGDKNGPPTEKELKKNPEWASARWVYRETELLEFSVVNVPANPEALITAVGKGHVSLSKDMRELLDVTTIVPAEYEPIVRTPVTVSTPVTVRPKPYPTVVQAGPQTEEHIAEQATKAILHRMGRMIPV